MRNSEIPFAALSPRLRAAAEPVRPGSRIADVGTDHAYLPIALVEAGVCPFAVASDVREGPLARAVEHIREKSLADRIETLLTDGLRGVEGYRPDDILICGMGGELIASILEESEYVRNPAIRLILQPMTMAHKLRLWLTTNGFAIDDETLVREHDRKLYQIIVAHYDGIARDLTPAQAYLGPVNLTKKSAHLSELAGGCMTALNTKIRGLQSAGLDASEFEEIVKDIHERVKEVGL